MLSFIEYNILRVPVGLKKHVQEFYMSVCGMKSYCKGDREIFSFPRKKDSFSTGLCIEYTENLKHEVSDPGYWKIGFSLQDVDSAVAHFRKTSHVERDGCQFVDIGYLTHLSDPAGNTIELLQHSFKENFKEITSEKCELAQPIAYPPSIGQITIRCKDAEKTCQFYSDVLGMKLLSVQQPAKKYPFTLYFYAYTKDNPPNTIDLTALENREWLWKQPFTQIELQHKHGTEEMMDFKYTTNDLDRDEKLIHGGFRIVVTQDLYDNIKDKMCVESDNMDDGYFVQDPDGYVIEISLAKQDQV